MKKRIYEACKTQIAERFGMQESELMGAQGIFAEADHVDVLDIITEIEDEADVEIKIDLGTPIEQNMSLSEFADYLFKNATPMSEYKKSVELWKSENRCSYCGGTFKKTLFSIKCISCGQKKDY